MKPAAVVNTDYPWMARFGWVLLLIGFALQLYSIEEPKLDVASQNTGKHYKLNPHTGLPHSQTPK